MSPRGHGPAQWAARVLSLPRPLLLAFDVDGTLAPIVDDPGAARVPPRVATALRRLAKVEDIELALITGRDLAGLRQVVRVAGAHRAVEHGAVVLSAGVRSPPCRLGLDDVDRLRRFLGWAERHAAGARLETKARAVGVHVRTLARQDAGAAEAILRAAAEQARALGLVPRGGRAVCEAEVAAGDKGTALRELFAAHGCRGVFFAGDDVTDGPALRAAVELGGVGLFVRSEERRRGPRGVSGSVDGCGALAAFVHHLEEAAQLHR